MSKLLLVSHEASLTGAPRVAVDILTATKELFDERVLVARWGGPLLPEFAAAATRVRMEPFRHGRVTLRRFRRTRRAAVALEEAAALVVLRRERPDVVYLNTVKSACYVRPALRMGLKVVLHSHETGDLASSTLNRYHLDGLFDRVCLVACSRAAQKDLEEITGVADINLIPSTIETSRVRTLAEIDEPLIEELAAAPAGRNGLVAACGEANRDKGADLWLEVAAAVKRSLGERCPLFVWVGDDHGGAFVALAGRLDVHDVVRFVGPRLNPYPLMRRADIVTVPFRFAPYPLVALEAMALGKPVVAFAVGGLVEQLGHADGLVPPEDADAMADKIVHLLNDAGARDELASGCSNRLEELAGAEQFREHLTRLLGILGAPG